MCRAADSADRQCAAHREIEIVGQHRRRQPARQSRIQDRTPGRAGVYHDVIGADVMYPVQCAHVDDDAAVDLRSPVQRVPLPARRDFGSVLGRPVHRDGYVLTRMRADHRVWDPAYEVAEVVARRLDGRAVVFHFAVERRKIDRYRKLCC